MTIRQLDDDTIRKIAAGEVVERPASVVKELVENSLDADASRIDVAVEEGGIERIRVADDGLGMSESEVELAVEEHTTSKIDDVDDLEAGVATLGFRGEALHAISAVSHTTITTKPRGGERATELEVDHGEVVSVESAGRPEGTTVEVTDLFGETPARRKFLKSTSTEFDHVNRIVTRYALANPEVAVSLVHDGREVFSTTGRGDLKEALLAVYGREVAESMIPVEAEFDADAPVSAVSGYVSHPETTRSTREYVSTFVNGRYVSSSLLRNAVVEAYGGQLAADRYPFAVVFLDLPPDAVDANVHPRKLEVRFDDDAGVRRTIEKAIEDALLDHGLLRTSAPRGRSAPDEASVEPTDTGPESTPDRPGTDSTSRAESTDADSAVTTDDTSPPREGSDSAAPPGSTNGSPESETDETPRERSATSHGSSASDASNDSKSRNSSPSTTTATDASDEGTTDPSSTRALGAGHIRERGTQRTLSDEPAPDTPDVESLPPMRVLGQFDDTYVVAETDEGLLLIDQHAADERINYERLREQLDSPATQALADPVEVELTAREAESFPDFADALADLGFRASLSGDRTVTVQAVPAVFDDALDPELLRDVLGEFLDGADTTSVNARIDELLSDLACYPSITGNTSLTEGTVVDLLDALDACENPYACPHGRPVFVSIDAGEIEDRFERDYPGHGTHHRA